MARVNSICLECVERMRYNGWGIGICCKIDAPWGKDVGKICTANSNNYIIIIIIEKESGGDSNDTSCNNDSCSEICLDFSLSRSRSHNFFIIQLISFPIS